MTLLAAQSDAVEPEAFQSGLIAGLTRALLRQPAPPCLLHAPTGSGKTFVISRVLENITAQRPALWLWFVPFVNLVQQTEDALASNCPGLVPVMLSRGRNQLPQSGQVWLSTAQGVARAKDRKAGYNADGDDDTRTLAETLARARAQNLNIGLVVDEAHIGLDKATEFGQFAHWLKPDFLLMATATPRDTRLLEFLQQAGMSAYEHFSASRAEVVEARLNKRYIEAVVYNLRQSVQGVADLQRTVLRQAWGRHRKLKKQLEAAGIALAPLLLVQVGNGDKTVEDAERDLITLCKVPPGVIGKHSADEPDPVLMAAIANKQSVEVLIFKQSAGTGFDAPRAFVLASTKPVNDPDFAMQFIGRVMRVARPVRAAYPRPMAIPPELDTAYVYLADANAQQGFADAVQRSATVKSQLEGQTERLYQRQTESGAVVFTNRSDEQPPLFYDAPLPPVPLFTKEPAPAVSPVGAQQNLFVEPDEIPLDAVVRATSAVKPAAAPQTRVEVLGALAERGIRAYARRSDLAQLPRALKREYRPVMQDMTRITHTAATRLPISDELARIAVRAALNRLREKEIHTELTRGTRSEEDVLVVTDRMALMREAQAAMKQLPQVEEEDIRTVVQVLAQRLLPRVREEFEAVDEDQRPDEVELLRHSRDAAHWVIRRESAALAELMQALIAEHSKIEDADALPDVMLFPAGVPLVASSKNIYGVMPPSEDDLQAADAALFMDERNLLNERRVSVADGTLHLAGYDALLKLNGEERAFAQSLDRADFVRWWHRNPDRKPYAVALVRGEHRNYFYPDFVVALSHYEGDETRLRLAETKQDVKDAARKARREPRHYGKVLFLTRDMNRLRVVNDDGSLGLTLDWDDLAPMREWLRQSRPIV